MEKEKAQRIVELISLIAEARAAVALNRCFDSTDKAIQNTEVLNKRENNLIELLKDISK